MDALYEVVIAINSVLLNNFLVYLLLAIGIFFTFKLGFIQFTRLGASFKKTFSGLTFKSEKADAEGMTSIQSLFTAIAAQIGTGNLAGVATAMVQGGPGAIFWMWVSALIGMATIYAEAVLAQKYKTVQEGEVVGGPSYYIQQAFKGPFGKFLAATFSVLLILALGFIGNMVQANSIGSAVSTAFAVYGMNVPTLAVGIVLGIVALIVFLGGVTRIVAIVEKIVPLMAIFFVIFATIGAVMNYDMIIPAFRDVFVGAFNPDAVLGGILGATVRQSIRYGVTRGLFTHEAGMGSTPHAHALAKVKHPGEQGLVAMMGVFIDTIILMPFTVLIISTTNSLGVTDRAGEFLTGIELTQYAFAQVFGDFGYLLVAICVTFFAFATIVGWYFFGHQNFKYLFGKKGIPIYSVLVAGFVVLGCTLKVDLVWELADTFNALMALPNIVALFFLANEVKDIAKDYDNFSKGNLIRTQTSFETR